jgi:hypothetical protein
VAEHLSFALLEGLPLGGDGELNLRSPER